MSTTPIQKTAQQALCAVMADVQGVAKKDRNESQGFAFRGIDAVVNAVGPALRKHGVVVVPQVEDVRYDTVEVGRNRTPMGHVVVRVAYKFYGPAGDIIEARVAGEAMDSGDKAVAKAMSVAFRIALLQSLALPTDEPDPDAASYERSEPAPPPALSKVARALAATIEAATTTDELHAAGDAVSSAVGLSDADKEGLREIYGKRRAVIPARADA